MAANPDVIRSLRGGDFLLTQNIGAGTFGETYAGYERRSRRPIAAKLLKVEIAPVMPANFQSLPLREQVFHLQLQNNYLLRREKVKDEFAREAATHARLK